MTSLSPSIQSVLELFKGPLGSVRFADIDAAGLATSAAEVEAAASEVEIQEAKLTELRQGLAQRQEALLLLAQQALAYARVYAENDEPLLEELNRISLPRAAKPRKPVAKSPSPREATRVHSSNTDPATESASSALSESDATDRGEAADPIEALESDVESSSTAPVEISAPTPPRSGRKPRNGSSQRAAS